MAKKTTAKKKPATKKKKRAGPATVESIIAECKVQVDKGLGTKRLSPEARAYWQDIYNKSVAKQLAKGDTWEADKVRVLPVAKKLGKVAAVLANGQIVLLWAAEAAAEAVRKDPTCPTPGGAGGYCEA